MLRFSDFRVGHTTICRSHFLDMFAVLHLARVLLCDTAHTPHDATHPLTYLHSVGAGGDVPDKRVQVCLYP